MKDVEKVKVYHVDEYCEGASHFCFSERKDVVLLEDYEKLRKENERLKKHNDELVRYNGIIDKYNDELEKENAKLRCTVLHLMKEFLSLKSKSLWAFFDSPAGRTMLSADEYERLRDKAWRICNHTTYYRKAYRKAKESLKEEK